MDSILTRLEINTVSNIVGQPPFFPLCSQFHGKNKSEVSVLLTKQELLLFEVYLDKKLLLGIF